MKVSTGILLLLATASTVFDAKHSCAAQPSAPPSQIKTVTIPERSLPEPEARGKPYPMPATKWELRPVLWGWTCELPDGSGLSFGGVHQTADDGNPHTSLKQGEAWKPIVEELRQSNPLQKRFEQVRALRTACKDALSKARHIYFEGKTADEEAKLLKADVDPAIEKLIQDLGAFVVELKGLGGLGEYEAGQVQFAMKHMGAAAGFIKPFGAQATPDQMATMRKAQIELEIATEAFDAEPPPRALSKIAFEPRTKLYVIFGGEHMDYSTNDVWVFAPAKRRWFQRHPETAPEPRCDAHLDPLGDGRVGMRGGCIYEPGKGYIHLGPARWIYDLEKNTWTADGHTEKTFPADTRSARYWPPAGPEDFMKGVRPDADANEAKLKALPINTWVRLKTPIPLGSRDWGTWVFDPDRDMLYVWAGGHGGYAGNDVARYHLATDHWEISDPIEIPLGCCGTNEQYPSGFNFNQRPWVKKHVWNSQAYDAVLKKMIMGGANDAKLDPYCYFYDPDKAEWTSRLRLPAGMPNDAYSMQIRYTKRGMFAWAGTWLFDNKAMEWKKLAVQGKIPVGGVDSSGMVYDPKRDRMLMATLSGYGKPFDGQLYALDMNALQVEPLNPEGMDNSKTWQVFLREVAWHPESDLFLWPQQLNRGGKTLANVFVAYDAGGNRWVTVKLNVIGDGQPTPFGVWNNWVNYSIAWDAKRGLFWLGDASSNGGVWALRFDRALAEVTPLKDFAPPPVSGEKR
ncbi:MAG: hypothetical protein NTW87_03455 [Planctomycetota bacterium]|nr:hypothetical protein [Planctomycetota bacterium]